MGFFSAGELCPPRLGTGIIRNATAKTTIMAIDSTIFFISEVFIPQQ
jgi:hypothetical protein